MGARVGREEERLESVDLVMGLLELLSEAPAASSLGEIATELDVSKPRVHRHLRALLGHGYVRQDSRGGYEAGARLLALGDRAGSRMDLADAARPLMLRLRDATGEAVTLSMLVGGEVTIVALVNGRTIVQFAIRPGTVMHPTRSAHGRIAASYGPAAPAMLDDDDVTSIRARGWAVASGGVTTGVNALAAPVFGRDGRWTATVAIVGSVDTIAVQPASALVAAVLATAVEISNRLGWKG